MEDNLEVIEVLEKMLPEGSEVVKIEDYYRVPAVIVSDLNGDDNVEVCVAYKSRNNTYKEIHIGVFKYVNEKWILIDTIIGEGIGISDFLSVPSEKPNINDLIVGWKLNRKISKLSIYRLIENKMISVLHDEVYYSRIEVEDMKGKNGRDNIYEFAIWNHDKLDAYNIKIYKLKNGRLVVLDDEYKEYYKGVANYYLGLIEIQGANPIYLYHLADAEGKAGDIKGAINTLNVLKNLQTPYPSREKVINLLESYSQDVNKVNNLL